MPSITVYPLDDLAALDRAVNDELSDRQAVIARHWAYYRREHKRPLKVRSGQPDDNVILNLAREVIDQSVAMLFGTSPDFELDQADETPEEQALEAIWAANKLPLWCQDVGVTGAVAGHVFVKLAPTPLGGVRLIRLNPRYVTMCWRADDFEAVLAYRLQWQSGNDLSRQDIVDMGDWWLVRDLVQTYGAREWTVKGEVIWPWAWPPIVDWKNLPNPEGRYGQPELVNPELNDTANFVASNTARILKFHAHPKTVGTGMQATEIKETTVDGLWTVANPAAQIKNLEMQSDLSSSAMFLEFVQAQFYAEHRAVNLASMKDRIGQLTNFGLRTLFKAALDKLQTKRSLYGMGLEEVSRRALLLMGYGDWPVSVSWGDPLPYNRLEQVQALQLERDMQIVSRKTVATELGRDWETEQARIEDEDATQGNVGEALLRVFDQGQGVPMPRANKELGDGVG
ncbi:phage portal protein [Candidatus Amarobacter glycogenicus]|uniref:phage portal protein n=1 Tax=Candidatus Amarobacter glycogenicus TaxID=3140699 RepID=UPI002A11B8CB|nr:phage portal protein [Dehalococcoidia bacterium]